MRRYRLSRLAEADLRRIWKHGYVQWGENQADIYYQKLIDRFEELAETPHLYPSVNHIRKGYRKSVCGVDTIYYRITESGVEIMRILGRQDIKDWL